MSLRPLSVAAVLGTWLTVALLPAAAQAPADDLNDVYEKAVKAAVAKVAPSVVQIETSGGTELVSTGPRGQPIRKGAGPTTGLVVAGDGYIISSAFNFANKPTAIFVTVPGHKERYVAKVVSTDHTRMLTLLKIDATGLTVPAPSPKKDFKVGQTGLALGRALDRPEDRGLSQPPSVSIGIISALNRIWGRAIQTDAKVSPANYGGPLVDIMGRVQGVLVPASPRAEGETAGFEWYDSGIGFAIPLEDINAVLPRLKNGDLRKGMLGITMQGADLYESPPTVATVAHDSAAARHGIKTGDTITSIDGVEVRTQAQLLHQLGKKYEGDTVNLILKRGNETVKLDNVKLAGALAAFAQPFLGILPMRDDPEPGEEVRFVYPDGPAAKAGLKAGDRITKFGVAGAQQLTPITGAAQLTTLLSTVPPGTEVKLEVVRKEGGKTETLTAKLEARPDSVPEKLPAKASIGKALTPKKGAPAPPAQPKDKKPETGLLERSNATRDHKYWVYVPDDYDPNISYSLLIWLHPVGKGKKQDMEDFKDAWEDICSDNHVIVLAPQAEGDKGWVGSEADFVLQAARDVMGQYTIDRSRVVAHGMGIGGQMAFYLGFGARDTIRAVATTGAVLGSPVKDMVANQPLSFYMVAGGKDPLVKDIEESKKKIAEKKFSVIYREIPTMGHQYLDTKTQAELARWLDSLDRQ